MIECLLTIMCSTIIGPNDRLITSTLTMPRVPVWDKNYSATNICVWDAAAAHLLLEDALAQDIDGAHGQAFLVTGQDLAWRMEDTRETVKVRPLFLIFKLTLMSFAAVLC